MITASNFESNIAETLASIEKKEEMKKWDAWAASHADRAGYEAWDAAREREEHALTLTGAKQNEKEAAREMWKSKGYWLDEHGWRHAASPDHPVFKDYWEEGRPLTKEEVWQAVGEERLTIGQAVGSGYLTIKEAILGWLRFAELEADFGGRLKWWQIVLCWLGAILGLIAFVVAMYIGVWIIAIVSALIFLGLGAVGNWIKNLARFPGSP
jgi:hypothetical protein